MSIFNEFDDEMFTEAIGLIVSFCKTLESAAGRKPTINEFSEFVVIALQSTHVDLFSDIHPGGVESLIPHLKKNPGKIQPAR